MPHHHHTENGQTLVALMVFMVIATTTIAAAVTMAIANTKATSRLELGETALSIANTGGENALLRSLRDPSYTGETMTVNGGTATVTVTGSNPKVITSVGNISTVMRTVQIAATGSGFLTVSSWKEIQ